MRFPGFGCNDRGSRVPTDSKGSESFWRSDMTIFWGGTCWTTPSRVHRRRRYKHQQCCLCEYQMISASWVLVASNFVNTTDLNMIFGFSTWWFYEIRIVGMGGTSQFQACPTTARLMPHSSGSASFHARMSWWMVPLRKDWCSASIDSIEMPI